MPSGPDETVAMAPRLGGAAAVVAFIATLLAFVIETQLTQFVQTSLGFRQPYLIFYIVHAAFALIFPIQFLYLITLKRQSPRALIRGLSYAITNHLSPTSGRSSQNEFPVRKFATLAVLLTLGYSIPGLLWFTSISLASVSDVTALWNTNAFFAYIFTVKLFQLKWEPRKLVAVLLATFGVIVVVYGGSTAGQSEADADSSDDSTTVKAPKATSPLLGDLLTLAASVLYGLYQVLYKKYVALPAQPEPISDGLYERVSSNPEDGAGAADEEVHVYDREDVVYPPFGLYPNLLTSLIGVLTFAFLWIPIPILSWYGAEPFSFPANWATLSTVIGIALSGMLFNAGFMVLLAIWGPVLVSVGNLLTIVLVLISDVFLGGATDTITVWSLMGAGVIVAAFGVLAYDMMNGR